MDNEDIIKQIVDDSGFDYKVVSKALDMHKLDDYLFKRYWGKDEEQMDLKRYLAIELIIAILYPVRIPDRKIFENVSDSLLYSVALFATSKYNIDYDSFFGKGLSNRIQYHIVLEKYILDKQLKPTQATILLETCYYLGQQSFYDKELVESVLELMSNPKINIANLKVLSNIIIDYNRYVFFHYVIDCGDRCIAEEIDMYNYKQLQEIHKGMKSNIDWKKYAYYMISENNMKIIRQLLESGIDVDFDNEEVDIKLKVFDNKKKKLF